MQGNGDLGVDVLLSSGGDVSPICEGQGVVAKAARASRVCVGVAMEASAYEAAMPPKRPAFGMPFVPNANLPAPPSR